MSKRYGNFLTVRDLRDDRWDAAALRYLFAQTQYRKQLNFTDDALAAAAAGATRLAEFRQRLAEAPAGGAGGALEGAMNRLEAGFRAAMDDDLDTPRALAVLMDFVREANRALDAGAPSAQEQGRVLDVFDRTSGVLQVVPRGAGPVRVVPVAGDAAGRTTATGDLDVVPAPPGAGEDLDAWAQRMAQARARARWKKDWATADAARRLLIDRDFEVRDLRDGTVEVRRRAGRPR